MPKCKYQRTTRTANTYAKVRSDDNAFVAGETYVIYSLGNSNGNTATDGKDWRFYRWKMLHLI